MENQIKTMNLNAIFPGFIFTLLTITSHSPFLTLSSLFNFGLIVEEPQDSVHVPFLSTLSTQMISYSCVSKYHLYEDDCKIYISRQIFSPELQACVSNYLSDVSSNNMTNGQLTLNTSKMEVLISTPSQTCDYSSLPTSANGATIYPLVQAKSSHP